MTLSRFHIASSEDATFSGDEAKHCSQVLRKHVGDQIIVFDGAGHGSDRGDHRHLRKAR